MLLLALDSSTPATSVALVATESVICERVHVDARRHAEVLSASVSSLFADSGLAADDLDGVVVGVGPGAFTGLRVGITSARAFGDALAVPVYGVVTLDAMAYECDVVGPFAVVADARRKELFYATYASAVSRTHGPAVATPEVVAEEIGTIPVVGADSTPYADFFDSVREPSLPSAGAIGLLAAQRLSSGERMAPPVPMYLRRPDAAPPTTLRSVLT